MCTVEIENAAGEHVVSLTKKGYAVWRRAMKGPVGFAISLGGDEVLITSRAEMKRLPPGSHTGKLVRKTTIPIECKAELRGCDLWKAMCMRTQCNLFTRVLLSSLAPAGSSRGYRQAWVSQVQLCGGLRWR